MKIIPTPETLAIDKAATDTRKHLAAASSDDLVKYLRASPTSLVMEAAADRIEQLEGMLAAVGAGGVSRLMPADDRKRRGAEVKNIVDDLRSHASMARWQAHSLSWLLDAVATHGEQKSATLTAAMSNLERMAMRLEDSANYIDMYAPQPAEPVKVPSDADLLLLWEEVAGGPKNNRIAFGRAVIERYGKPAQTAEGSSHE